MSKKAILQDLAKDLRSWQTAGEMVVVLVDFNEHVTSKELNQFFCEFNLVKVVMALHKGNALPMYNHGSKLINGIFIPTQFLPHC